MVVYTCKLTSPKAPAFGFHLELMGFRSNLNKVTGDFSEVLNKLPGFFLKRALHFSLKLRTMRGLLAAGQ